MVSGSGLEILGWCLSSRMFCHFGASGGGGQTAIFFDFFSFFPPNSAPTPKFRVVLKFEDVLAFWSIGWGEQTAFFFPALWQR